MSIFLILAIYLLVVMITVPESKRMQKSFIAAFGFILVLSLRSPFCGLDVTGTTGMIMPHSYGGVFLSMPNFSFWTIIKDTEVVDGHMEIGWLLLTKCISLFTNNLQVYLTIIAFLQIIPIAYVIGKYSNNIVLSYFIFACLGFYVHYFSGIRQTLALSIIILAFDQLYRNRYAWYVFFVLLASSIHISAVFFFIMWPLYRMKLPFLVAIAIIAGMLAIMPLYQGIISKVLDILFESRFEGYLDDEGSAITMFIVYGIILLASYVIRAENPMLNYLRMLLLVGVASQSLGVLGNGAITRIGYYFNVFLMILLPEMINKFKESERGSISMAAIILLCVFFVLTTTETNSSGVIPYKFFWEESLY